MTGIGCLALCAAAASAWAQNKPGAGDLLNNIAPPRKNGADPGPRKTDKLLIQKNTEQAADETPADDVDTLAM